MLAADAGTELTCRIVATEHADGLVDDLLARWTDAPEHDVNGIALLARTPSLREAARERERGEPGDLRFVPTMPYYDGAPGVAAPPR